MNVLKDYVDLFGADEFYTCREEIEASNRAALHLFPLVGIPLGVANILAQSVLRGRASLSLNSSLLLCYFVLLLIADWKLIPQKCRHSTLLLYLLEVPVMVTSILLGTVWDPGHQALTFMMFLMAMPVFILDYPARVMGASLGWSSIFVVFCLLVKDPATHRGDFFHLLEFFLSSMTVTLVVLYERLQGLRRLEQTRYYMEHDGLTGLGNEFLLARKMDGLLGAPVLVFVSQLDQLDMYEDFYGKDAANEIICGFADVVKSQFDRSEVYRSGGGELLCIVRGGIEEDCLIQMDECREELLGLRFKEFVSHLTCTFGYVTGVAGSVQELRDMIHLAEIYAHRAKQRGIGQTQGSLYDGELLRREIAESTSRRGAKFYEINQLTGLPSLSYFIARCDDVFGHLIDYDRQPVMVYFNILRLREFNDRFGYQEGDELIRYTAMLLKEIFPDRHMCYISSARFAILCYLSEAEEAVRPIRDALSRYNPSYEVRFNAGAAACSLREAAMSSLDKAKRAQESIQQGSQEYLHVYDTKMDEDFQFRQYIIGHVEDAVENGWLKVYYQPIVRAATGEICNEEALSRWDDPEYGFLSPGRFVPILEKNRLSHILDLFVIRKALQDCRRRMELGVPVVPVSVNLSRCDLGRPDIVREIASMVDDAGFPRSQIRIEITESSFVEDETLLSEVIASFRSSGFEVWIDDFGSEYSTLNMLQDLDFDLIKIDMQFMRHFEEGGKNRIIVSDIIDMARRMGITTLIEGVEDEESFEALREMGGDKIQGYLFGKPDALENIIQRHRDGTGLPFEKQ